jgi:precorrin-6A/cobalt-precorrin-6A reductase
VISSSRRTSARGAPLRVLVLGGTRDAYELATALVASAELAPLAVTSSLAGRTASPLVPPGGVRSGGFGGVAGLAAYLECEGIDAAVDATHPFAATISRNAVLACARIGVPLLGLERPRWTPVPGDRWERVPDVAAAALRARALGQRIFLTIGRQGLAPFAAIDDRWFLVRAIDPPEVALPPRHTLLLARGPFALADEFALLRRHAIDVVVAKDSGGDATAAKLTAARTLGIAVVVVDRPPVSGAATVAGSDAVIEWLAALRAPANAR